MDDSHDMADDIDWMYGVGDRLQHVKTGRFYVVRTLAFDEATATPVYVYSLDSWSNQTEWVRAKDVMEDGRFVYAPKPTEAQKDAEIAQLRADLAKLSRVLADERAAVAIAHERIAEVTAERDARPEISRVDARRYIEWRDGFSPHPANVDRLEQVDDALRAHAAGSGKGGDDA